jgi:hypothetical protein
MTDKPIDDVFTKGDAFVTPSDRLGWTRSSSGMTMRQRRRRGKL